MNVKPIAWLAAMTALASCHRETQNVLSASALDQDAAITSTDIRVGAVPMEHVWSRGFGSDGEVVAAIVALPGGSVVAGTMEVSAMSPPNTPPTNGPDATPVGGLTAINIGGADLPVAGIWSTGYIARLDVGGAVVWSKSFSGTGGSRVAAVAVASDGDLIVTGSIQGAIDLGGGTVTASVDNGSGFIIKLAAADGALRWGRLLGVSGPLAIDPNGNIYTVGVMPAGTLTLDGVVLDSSSNTAVVVALDAVGSVRWAHVVGGSGPTISYADAGADDDAMPMGGYQRADLSALCADGQGVVIAGGVSGDADLGAGLTTGGQGDGLLMAYDTMGSFQWAHRFNGMVGASSISLLADGSIAEAGALSHTATIDAFTITPEWRDTDGFIAAFDRPTGAARWAVHASVGGTLYQLAQLPSGDLITVGSSGDLGGWDAGAAFLGVFSSSDGSAMIERAYPHGTIYSAAVTASGDVLIAGQYPPQAAIDLGAGQLPVYGEYDAFVGELRLP